MTLMTGLLGGLKMIMTGILGRTKKTALPMIVF